MGGAKKIGRGAPACNALRLGGIMALVLALSVVGACRLDAAAGPMLDQGWSQAETELWYDASQGSRLIPKSWFEALEQPGGPGLFLEAAHVAKFRYLPREGALPVGFALDDTDDAALSNTKLRWKTGQTSREFWVGLNCSACHTAQITYKGAPLRIEGGPTLADFQGFMETFNRSLTQTLTDDAKFSRFAARVLGPDDTSANRLQLRGALGQLVARQLEEERLNATDLRYGFGRLDAFGHIYNKVALVAGAAAQIARPSDAPVAYPAVWNAPQLDRVQWNAIAQNERLPGFPADQPFDIGALGRNAGEAIGVFADITPVAGAPLQGYGSSVRIGNLVSMEQLLGRLRPPAWPALFGAPDPTQVAAGQALFGARCQGCHETLARTDLSAAIKVKTTPLRLDDAQNTDPWAACNAFLKESPSGLLQGAPVNYFTGAPLGASAPLSNLLTTTVVGALAGEKGGVLRAMTFSFFGQQPPPIIVGSMARDRHGFAVPHESLSLKEQALRRCLSSNAAIVAYKSRPLTGVWAMAPFLHNGSTPTLYDLLLPPDQRPESFYTGAREFDPVKVGYVTAARPDNPFLFRTRDLDGAMVAGNSNAGHDYGNAAFSEADRAALIAYMKTL